MKIYIANIVLLTLIGLLVERFSKSRRLVKVYCFYAWLQLTAIAAVRIDLGIDYSQYYHAFYAISDASDWSELFQQFRYETGYLILNRLISMFTNNIVVFMAIYHGLMYGLLIFYIYRYCEEKWIAILSFIALDYFAMSLCFMRQSMAIIIGLYAIEYMRRHKWYIVLPLVLLASSFHISALVLLLYYLLSYIKWEKRWIQIVSVIACVMIYIGCDFILDKGLVGPFERYRGYLTSRFMMGNAVMIVFYPVFCSVLFFVFRKKLEEEDQTLNNLVPMLFLGGFLTILSLKHYVVERVALYITIYNIRLIPMMVHCLYRKKQQWNYQLAVISALIISMSAFVFGITTDRYGITPYQMAEDQLEKVPFFKESIRIPFGRNQAEQ